MLAGARAAGARGFKVLVTRKIPEVALQRLRSVPGIELDIYPETSQAIPAEELKKRAAGVDGMLVLLTDKVSSDLIEVGLPRTHPQPSHTATIPGRAPSPRRRLSDAHLPAHPHAPSLPVPPSPRLSPQAAGKNLKIVSTMSVGYNHVDTAALARAGVALGSTSLLSPLPPSACTAKAYTHTHTHTHTHT